MREGVLRAHRLRHGLPLNMLIMGILRGEFESSCRPRRAEMQKQMRGGIQ